MIRRWWPFLLLAGTGWLVGPASATTPPELQPGLTYLPLAELAQTPPAAAWVLDARQAGDVAATHPSAWERLTARAHPGIVLLDVTSPAWLHDWLAGRSALILTLAAAGTYGPVDLEVATPAQDDALARQALAAATDFSTALGRMADKRRRDQTTLNGSRSPPTPVTAEIAGGDATEEPEDRGPPDLVLQRAVQVFAGLRALGLW